MNSMSDALQKAAGDKMKKVLGFLIKNPIMSNRSEESQQGTFVQSKE